MPYFYCPGNNDGHDIVQANSRFASLVEAVTCKSQPLEILQSAAQAVTDGMVFNLEPSDETESPDHENGTNSNNAESQQQQEGSTEDSVTPVSEWANPFEKETKEAAHCVSLYPSSLSRKILLIKSLLCIM
jgi:stringent starvation protein B